MLNRSTQSYYNGYLKIAVVSYSNSHTSGSLRELVVPAREFSDYRKPNDHLSIRRSNGITR